MAHSNIESLYEYVPKDYLPKEYGGSAGSIEDILSYWETKLFQYRSYLMEEAQFGTNEKNRSVPSDLAQSIFGISGVFKKLEFD